MFLSVNAVILNTVHAVVSLDAQRRQSPKCSPESRMHELPRGERHLSQSGCLFMGKGRRSILPPHTVIWEPDSHKHMLNDSIYSLCHYLFLSFLMILPICAYSFLSPLVFFIHSFFLFNKCLHIYAIYMPSWCHKLAKAFKVSYICILILQQMSVFLSIGVSESECVLHQPS